MEMESKIEQRLEAMNITLPVATKPAFQYSAVVLHRDIAFVSGQLPRLDADSVIEGKLGDELSIERGQVAARLCALHALANLKQALGSLERVERILKLTGFVASAPGFNAQPKVIDGASELLVDIFGDNGRHARSAVGVAELPRGAAVEIEMIVAVRVQLAR